MLFENLPNKIVKLSEAEIESAKTPKGGWTKKQLAEWGVSWPPPKGWKRALILGCALEDLPPEEETERESHPDSIESAMLHQVVMAVINTGQGDILKGIDDLNAYYNCKIPTVADIVGSRPETALIHGGIEWDDKVYSFSVARTVRTP